MCAVRRPPDRPPHRPPPGPCAGALARASFLALVALLATIPPAFARDPASEQREADARQKLYVRRAFDEDAGLAPHACDVWVEVRGTTVVLSGKLPSATLKQRALFLAGQVKGVAVARGDDLQVEPKDGFSDLPSPFIEGVPPHGTLAGNHKDGRTTDAPKMADVPQSGPSPASRSLFVTLEPPVPVTGLSSSAPPGPAVQILQPRPLPDPPDLPSVIEALRRKDERFRRVTIEVRQRSVYLRGTVGRWDDVTELANAVRRLPGVEAVILDNVHVDRLGGR
ncbi:MAG TPA: BON domain-containing protein [Gemmataceae bacterium]|nr:BON domain-containing protein [Gemmataceae bacterium]